MVITTLIENLVYQKGLIAEHGLSFHIELDGKSILFDTGQGEGFIHNAKKLNIDLTKTDLLIISHGHYDHIGGIHAFLKVNPNAKILLKKQALAPKYKNKEFIGTRDIGLLPKNRIEFIDSFRKIGENLFIIPDIKELFPIDNHKKEFYNQIANDILPDTFDDELFLCFQKDSKLTILSSCSHNGITNIIETARDLFKLPVSAVLGGFHTKEASKEEIEHIISYLNENNIEHLGVCHCTGIDTYVTLKNGCKSEIKYLSTGYKIILT
jgi:7,8-dihydropterin-6-yl-methyl-4-(beta-D-ribofuranosyl)aminobenzene 5'-phosphate synthase